MTSQLRAGLGELEVADLMHGEVARRGLGYAWGRDHCPAVNAGPEKEIGHAPPGELRTRRGELLHVDFGVTRAEYTSDLQRVWYFLDDTLALQMPDISWGSLWPVFLIVLGAVIIWRAALDRKS